MNPPTSAFCPSSAMEGCNDVGLVVSTTSSTTVPCQNKSEKEQVSVAGTQRLVHQLSHRSSDGEESTPSPATETVFPPASPNNTTTLINYNENDVLIGRFNFCRENGGTRHLNRLILQHQTAYAKADLRTDYQDVGMKRSKDDIKKEVHQAIKLAKGRFLKVLDKEGRCEEASDADALKHIVVKFAQEIRKTTAASSDPTSEVPILEESHHADAAASVVEDDGATETSSIVEEKELCEEDRDYDYSWMGPFTMVSADRTDTFFPPAAVAEGTAVAQRAKVVADLEPTRLNSSDRTTASIKRAFSEFGSCVDVNSQEPPSPFMVSTVSAESSSSCPLPGRKQKKKKKVEVDEHPCITTSHHHHRHSCRLTTPDEPRPCFDVATSPTHDFADQVAQLTNRVGVLEAELRRLRQLLRNARQAQ